MTFVTLTNPSGADRTDGFPFTEASRHRGPSACPSSGFTLIEVLVVVAIVGLLVSILIPSLSRAREQARTLKCLSNMSNMPKAVLSFATEHGGYAQMVGEPPEWKALDPSFTKYEYQSGIGAPFSQSGPWLKPWPIAYAKQLGIPTLKRMENYFTPSYQKDAQVYFKQFGRHDIFICPSDKILVHDAWSPYTSAFGVFGVLSYSANEDVFGVTGVYPGQTDMSAQEGQPWADGKSGDIKPARAKRLEGRMDKIVRPSEVALFCDGGNEDNPSWPALLITNDASLHGPYLENYERAFGRLPHYRHSDKGGVAVAFADGSGKYAKPIDWTRIGAKSYVKRYAPRVRVSPYEVGQVNAIQP